VAMALLAAACQTGATTETAVEAGVAPVDAAALDAEGAMAEAGAAPDRAGDVVVTPDQGGRDLAPQAVFPPPGNQRLRGHLVMGFEKRVFQSCGLGGEVWVELMGAEPGLDKLKGVVDTCPAGGSCPGQTIYVELDATVAGPCQCGHLGMYEWMLYVRELLVASRTSPPDCPR
jgi:hypothetical protein